MKFTIKIIICIIILCFPFSLLFSANPEANMEFVDLEIREPHRNESAASYLDYIYYICWNQHKVRIRIELESLQLLRYAKILNEPAREVFLVKENDPFVGDITILHQLRTFSALVQGSVELNEGLIYLRGNFP